MKKLLLFLALATTSFAASTGPINNGYLVNDLDARGHQIQNLDTSNLSISGGGGGGSGLTAITLNVPSILFSGPVNFTIAGTVATGNLVFSNAPATTLFGNLSGSPTTPTYNSFSSVKTALSLENVNNTSDASKPISSATQAALDLKESTGDHSTDIGTLNATVALKASTTYVDSGLALKADAAATTASLATKQDSLLATTNDGWVLARHTAGAGGAFFFVDPAAPVNAFTGSTNIVTLGTIATGTWQGTSIAAAHLPSLDAITAPAANLSLNSHKITALADPSSNTDAANKQYVDGVAAGGVPHPAVLLATTANITLSGEQAIDTITTSASRVLVKNQTTGSENGIYVSGAGAWTRATDSDVGTEIPGSIFVSAGSTNAATTWSTTTPQTITVGSTSISYTLTGASSVYTAGNGLTLIGNQFSALGTGGRITVGGGTIDIASSYVGQNTIVTLGTLTTGTWNASLIAGQYGGTGVNNSGKTLTLSANATLGGTNTGDISLVGTPSFLSLTNQVLTMAPIATADVANSAITYAKMQNVTTGSKLLGRYTAGAGVVQELSLGTGLSLDTGTGVITATGEALGNPSSNGQVLASTTGGVRSWVSKENPLTFGSPLSRTSDTITIPQATSLANGYLNQTDFAIFSAKENALTFSAPLSRATNTISLPVATASANGYLTSADWIVFNNKIPSTRNINTTSPLAGGGALSSDLTLSMAASTNSVNGYLTSTDHALFAGKAGGDSEVLLTNTLGLTGSPATWTAGATSARETVSLSQDRYVTLPAASGYQAGKIITYTDNITTGNFGRYLRRNGSDLLNGGSVDFRPFIAGATGAFSTKSIQLQNINQNEWRVINTAGNAISVQSSTDATKSFVFDAGNQTPGFPGTFTAGTGSTVSVAPTTGTGAGVLLDINDDGSVSKGQLAPSELVPLEYTIGQAGVNISTTSYTVTSGYDVIRIAGNLQGPITIHMPQAGGTSGYVKDTYITLLDASSTVSASHAVTLDSPHGDTFNSSSSQITLTETGMTKVFISDGADPGNWSFSTGKVTTQPFTPLSASTNTFTLVADPNIVEQHARLNLASGANNLQLSGAFDGMKVQLIVVQPSSGAAGTLNLPVGTSVAGSGLGVVSLTATNNAKDTLDCSYDGNDSTLMCKAPSKDYTTAALPTAPSGLATGSITASKVPLTWTDNANNENGFTVERAPGLSQTSGFVVQSNTIASSSPASATGGTISYNDLGVSPATDYTYRVNAYNAGGASTYSSTVNATTSSGGPTAELLETHFNEGTGSSIAATTIPGGGVNLNLNYSTDWTSSTQSGTGNALHSITGLTGTGPVTVTPTCSGTCSTTWTYRVAAFKTVSGLRGSGTSGTTALGAASLSGGNHNVISWTAVTGADYYQVYRVTAGGTPADLGIIAANVPSGTLTFDDTGITHSGATPANIATATDIHGAFSPSTTFGVNQMTVSFWAKGTFGVSQSAIIGDYSAGGGAATSFKLTAGSPATKFSMTFPAGTGSITGTVNNNVDPATTGNNVNSGTGWHLIVIEMDNSGVTGIANQLKFYFDGNHAQTVTASGTQGSGAKIFTPAVIAVGSNLGSAADYDDVRIYNRLLSTTEIATLYSGGAQ